ncbi:hypothetical protein Hanom_Chr14g01323031 [Helianthus anomalus]
MYRKQLKNPHVHNYIARLKTAYEQFVVVASRTHLPPNLAEFPPRPVKELIISCKYNLHLLNFNKSKMSFSSLRFGQFCNFHQKVCNARLDPKGLKSCHFHPAR